MRQSGFTLTELVISLGLGLGLMAGVVNLLVQSNRSMVREQQVTAVLNGGRFLISLMSRELAMAGYWGAVLDAGELVVHESVASGDGCAPEGESWFTNLQGLRMLDDATSGTAASRFPCLPATRIVPGADILAIQRVADNPTGDELLESGRLYLSSDGVRGVLFRGGSAGTPPDISDGHSNRAFLPQFYYLRNYSISTGDGLPALCQSYLVPDESPYMSSRCLVDGVENLQLELGIDLDGDWVAEYYTSSPDTPQFAAAVAVRLHILVRSARELPDYVNDKVYQLGAVTAGPAHDGYYRRVFSTTVRLRNLAGLRESIHGE